jgi:hypothetical protein
MAQRDDGSWCTATFCWMALTLSSIEGYEPASIPSTTIDQSGSLDRDIALVASAVDCDLRRGYLIGCAIAEGLPSSL